jgi:hypothetical protein
LKTVRPTSDKQNTARPSVSWDRPTERRMNLFVGSVRTGRHLVLMFVPVLEFAPKTVSATASGECECCNCRVTTWGGGGGGGGGGGYCMYHQL